MNSSIEKYLQEFEKYKNIEILEGKIYNICSGGPNNKQPYRNIRYLVLKVDLINNSVQLQRTDKTNPIILTKTLHWARKNLLNLETQISESQ